MADHVFMVLSTPPEDVSSADFSAWYDLHLRQILELPGWVAAQRFSMTFVRGTSEAGSSHTHCVRYEIEGHFEQAWQALRSAVDGGRMDFPEWFPRVETMGWLCDPASPRTVALQS